MSQPFSEQTEELLYRAQRAIKDATTRETTRLLLVEARERRYRPQHNVCFGLTAELAQRPQRLS